MYPPKNGPVALAKHLKISINQLPEFDPHDEISGDPIITQNLSLKYAQQLSQLTMMGYNDQERNLRQLLRKGDINEVIEQYLKPQTFEVSFIFRIKNICKIIE